MYMNFWINKHDATIVYISSAAIFLNSHKTKKKMHISSTVHIKQIIYTSLQKEVFVEYNYHPTHVK